MANRKQVQKASYFQIVKGNIATYVKEQTENSVMIDGRHFELFESIEGKLKKVYIYDKEFSENKKSEMLVIGVENSDGVMENLEVNFNSDYARTFICKLNKIFPAENLIIKAYRVLNKEKSAEKKKDVYNEGLTVIQDGEKIQSAFNKENPLPEAVKKKKKNGEVEYDFFERDEKLREIVDSFKNTLINDYKNESNDEDII